MDSYITGKWALVTGASGGLGEDFAHELGKCGCNVVLVARRRERLEEVAGELEKNYGVETEIIVMDLAVEEAPGRLHQKVKELGLEVVVLVNNAGFGIFGEFADIGWERERNMLQLDMITVTHLTKLFVKDMMERNFGYILQVASIGGYQPSPTYATYSAAKSYVLHFGEALNYELRNTGVSCTVVSPGITRTRFLEVSGQKPSLYQRLVMMESEDVARISVNAMLRRKASVVPGWLNKITIWSNRLLPRRVTTAVASLLMTTGQR